MIFNGGMVANYVVVANMLRLNNTIWCLILPLAMSSFNVIICKTFFRTTVPDSIIESAKIDGASQMKIFWRIVVPISKPVFATIALFLTFGYWNDWFPVCPVYFGFQAGILAGTAEQHDEEPGVHRQ